MSKNTEVWDKLSKTDPKHTKSFTRAGGFKGTAIKPIYTTLKMTEEYGPEGVGWGFDAPQYQVVPTPDGQIAVYCWTSLWFSHEGKVSAPVHGVGGDMVVVKQQNGMRVNDEAFKAAFTDAKGNALKEIGMSADVHMGLFDDHKYVREREEEERKAPKVHEDASGDAGTPVGDSTSKLIFPSLQNELRGCATAEQLRGAWERWLPVIVHWSETMQQHCEDVRKEMADYLAEHAGDARSANREVIEADLRASVSEADLNRRWSGWGDAMRKLGKDDVTKLQGVAREVKAAAQAAEKAKAEFEAGAEFSKAERMAAVANTP